MVKMALLWSLAPVLAGFVLGELLRIVLKRVLPKKFHPYAKELISTFQLSVYAFEINVVGKFYSAWVGLSCSFVLLTLKNTELILEGALANPCAIWEGVIDKKGYFFTRDNVAKITCQVIGGILSFPFTQVIWQAKWSDFHEKQVERGLQSTLEVSLMYGFLIETLGTFITTMCDFLSRGPALKNFNAVIRAASIVVVCYFLAETTGVWMNPALATAQTFVFCTRQEAIHEHLFVFWLGPTIGTLIAIQVKSLLSMSQPQKAKDKKTNERWNGNHLSGKTSKNEETNDGSEVRKRHTAKA